MNNPIVARPKNTISTVKKLTLTKKLKGVGEKII
jgi:hypothetical protein